MQKTELLVFTFQYESIQYGCHLLLAMRQNKIYISIWVNSIRTSLAFQPARKSYLHFNMSQFNTYQIRNPLHSVGWFTFQYESIQYVAIFLNLDTFTIIYISIWVNSIHAAQQIHERSFFHLHFNMSQFNTEIQMIKNKLSLDNLHFNMSQFNTARSAM